MILKLYDFGMDMWIYIDKVDEIRRSFADQYVFKKFSKEDKEVAQAMAKNVTGNFFYTRAKEDSNECYCLYDKYDKCKVQYFGGFMFSIHKTLEVLEFPEEMSLIMLTVRGQDIEDRDIMLSADHLYHEELGKRSMKSLGYLLNDVGQTVEKIN